MKQRPVVVYVALLAAAAAGCGGVLSGPRPGGAAAWPALPAFVALLAGAEYFFVRYQLRGHVDALNLFEAVLAPLILGFPGVAVMAAVLVAQSVAAGLRRNQLIKAAFNVVQWTLAAGVGALVFSFLGAGPGASGRNLAAMSAALVAVSVVNQLAFIGVMALASGQGLGRVVRELAPAARAGMLLSSTLNLAVGLLLAAAYAAAPVTVILFAVPLGMMRWALLAAATARADRARLAGLQRAAHALARPVDPREAIPAFLGEVRESFEAEVVDLLLFSGGTGTVHRLRGGDIPALSVHQEPGGAPTLAGLVAGRGSAVRISAGCSDMDLARLLRAEGWRDCLGVPLTNGSEPLGALCTYNRAGMEGFEDGELAVLEALAGEMASTLERASLVDSILEERAKLDQIVSHASDGIATIDTEGIVRSWNPGMEHITGYSAASMIGSNGLPLLRPRSADGSDVLLERWAELSTPLPQTLQILAGSGECRTLSCSYADVAGGERSPGVLVVVARDVTDAQGLARLKDDLIATVSHEFRTPLVPIRGWAELMSDTENPLSGEQRDLGVRMILRNAVRLEQLVENFLEVAKVERDFETASMVDIDVASLVGGVVEDLGAAHPDRDIRLELPGRALAVGHGLWVERIVSNLVGNAIKYSPGGSPIDVVVTHGSDAVEVAVIDSGPGIERADLDRVFGRFERLEAGVQPGTGLGLYIARQLATAMGAEVTVDSIPGEGSVFTLRLVAARQLRVVG